MRKLVVSMNVSLDGFMAGPAGELDWHFPYWTDEMADVLAGELSKADTILLGANTYSVMAAYWPFVTGDTCYPRADLAYADMMNNHLKLLASTRIKKPAWQNTQRLTGDFLKQLAEFKITGEKEILLYGSGKLVRSLQLAQLVDRYMLWAYPVAIGKGKELFSKGESLQFSSARSFSCGAMLMVYDVIAPAQQTDSKTAT